MIFFVLFFFFQEPRRHWAYQGVSRHPQLNSGSLSDKYSYNSALYPVATTNGNHGFYGNNQEDSKGGYPQPPFMGTVEEMSSDPAVTSSRYSERLMDDLMANHKGSLPRNKESKSMDLVADESNVRSLAGHRKGPTAGGTLGPTLGLWKSSSLESLQSAMSESQHNDIQAQVPFHRPRPHMVRGRGCNQSFRIAIDKSYEGPSEDDDDPSEFSSGHETPVSSSSRQDLDVEDVRMRKKVNGKKQEKKSKGKKRSEDAVEDMEKKTKKKGFALLSDQRPQGMRREYPEARAAPGYEELDAARRRVLENNPHRVAPRGEESRPLHLYEELDLSHPTHTRRDPYDYPTHSRSAHREPAHSQDHYRDKNQSAQQPASYNQRHHTSSSRVGQQHRAAMPQDVLPSPTTGRKGRHHYEAVRNERDGYRQASPGRYASPDRYGYRDDRQPDQRRKNPMIGAV
ncbi:par-3 family cell polarity regulator beta a isoform X2 [Vanacampus margaritifer]